MRPFTRNAVGPSLTLVAALTTANLLVHLAGRLRPVGAPRLPFADGVNGVVAFAALAFACAGLFLLIGRRGMTGSAEVSSVGQLRALAQLAAFPSRPQDRGAVANAIVEIVAGAARADVCTVHLLAPDEQTLELVAERGVSTDLRGCIQRFSVAMGVLRDVVSTGSVLWFERKWSKLIKTTKCEDLSPGVGARASGWLPLIEGGRIFGVLGLGFDHRAPSTRERAFAETLSEHAAHSLIRGAALLGEREARTRAERERDQVADVLRSEGDAVIATDGSGRVTLLNPRAEVLTGWAADEARARPIEDVLHLVVEADDARAPAVERVEHVEHVEQHGLAADGPLLLVTKSGARRVPIRRSEAPLVDAAGTTRGSVVVFRESEAEEAAELRRDSAGRAKDQFLATVSHELRTPLSAILGWSRMIRAGSLSEAKREHAIEVIERNAVAMAQLVEDLLEVSRITSGKIRLEMEPVELATVVQSAMDSVRPLADAKRIRIELALEPGSSEFLGDPVRLRQVVWNLLTNSVKYTPENGRVRVSVAQFDSSTELVVTDDGIGIEPRFLKKIFEPFQQGNGAVSRAHGGLGLGLAISKSLVELHGGEIRAESAGRGCGSRFVVRLPMRSAGLPPPPVGRPDATLPLVAPPSELRGLHVLVVDDDEDARLLVTAILEQCGAVVRTASSAAEGYADFVAERPQVLLSDIAMPGEDGYSFIRRIRSSAAANHVPNVPAAALTAYARAEDRKAALSAGYLMHVPKPVEPAELVEVVANLARLGAARQPADGRA